MAHCPFQRPVKRTQNWGDISIESLVYAQHPGFIYKRTLSPVRSTGNFQEWTDCAFSNLIYLMSGSLSVQIPDQGVKTISAGQWIFVSALQQFTQLSIKAGSTAHWIECDASVWTALHQDHSADCSDPQRRSCILCNKRNEALVFSGDQTQKLRLQLLELNRLTGEQAIERLKVASLSYELLSTTLESSEFGRSTSYEPCVRDADLSALEAAAKFLENNLDADHSLQKLSRQFYLNEFKLKRGFKARFQTTVFGYLRQKRMEYAKNLLLQSDASVLEIATRVGYSNPSHFTRAFRETFGVNPGKIRKTSFSPNQR